MTDRTVEARALLLFERLIEAPDRRTGLLADEPDAVVAAVEALEEVAPRARAAFPTEEDASFLQPAPPLPGRVGPYRLGEKLGEGGMGMVFAADRADGLFDHRVAIKLIHPDRFSDRASARFAEERQILARLQHPGIARLLDGGVTADGWPYIIMELVDGPTLDAYAARPGQPMPARMALIEQVCDAVAAAHASLVVHGDLKPANVIVDSGGRVRLLDFGVARLIEDHRLPVPQPMTVAFASPAVRGGAPPGVADDVFGLGILIRAVANAGVEDGHLHPPGERDLAAIADKAAAADPSRRYRSVDAVTTDLARWRQKKPVDARPASLAYIASRFVRRRFRELGVAALVVGVLLALTAFSVAGWRTAGRRTALAAERTDDLRRLARYQLSVLTVELENQPRSTALRRNLALEAERVLARAVAASGATPALRRDAAEGYRLLAQIEASPTRPSLGRPDRATMALGRAEALLAGDPGVAGRTLLARVLLDHAIVAGAGNDTAQAMALLRRARPFAGADLADDIALVEADALIWNGDYAAAERMARSVAAHHREAPPSVAEALLHDRMRDRQAEATFYAGDEIASAGLYRQAADALAAAQRRWPGDAALDWALARQRWNLGVTLIDLGHAPQALPLVEAARATFARIVSADPDDMAAARRLRSYGLATAQALAAVGEVDRAVAMLRANIAERRRWAMRAPDDTARTRDLAIAVGALGDVEAAAGRAQAACADYDEVRGIHAALGRRGRLSRLDADYFAGLIAAGAKKLGCPGG